MKSLLQLFSLVFLLGIFIIPKDQLYFENTAAEQCCKTPEKNDCCNSNQKQHTKGCKEKCCAACHTCTSFLNIAVAPNENFTHFGIAVYHKKNAYTFSNLFFSSHLREIWEPPKIG